MWHVKEPSLLNGHECQKICNRRRLHMSEKLSSGTINYNKKQKLYLISTKLWNPHRRKPRISYYLSQEVVHEKKNPVGFRRCAWHDVCELRPVSRININKYTFMVMIFVMSIFIKIRAELRKYEVHKVCFYYACVSYNATLPWWMIPSFPTIKYTSAKAY